MKTPKSVLKVLKIIKMEGDLDQLKSLDNDDYGEKDSCPLARAFGIEAGNYGDLSDEDLGRITRVGLNKFLYSNFIHWFDTATEKENKAYRVKKILEIE